MLRRHVLVVLVVLASACGPAVNAADPAAPATAASADDRATASELAGRLQPSESFGVSDVVFTNGSDRIGMPVLVAETATQRATGLMNRSSLPDGAGMLFVFSRPVRGAFWMMDTTIPLSIAFVGQDGTVQQIMDMEPCAAEPCPRYEPDDDYLYAIEANKGYFASRGITPGWTVQVSDELVWTP